MGDGFYTKVAKEREESWAVLVKRVLRREADGFGITGIAS
jgi:hypothetical protein